MITIEEIKDVFQDSANFAPHALLTLAPPSDYALNLKALIKVSNISTSQLSYEILRSSFERKFDKTNFISLKRTPHKSPHRLGLIVQGEGNLILHPKYKCTSGTKYVQFFLKDHKHFVIFLVVLTFT